jgi:hypothetical protein
VLDKIEVMVKKFELFSVALTKTTHMSFHHCMICLCANELKLMDNVKCDIAKHLSELGAQLRRYFPETDDTNNWTCYPFHALPPVHLPISEQESLIKIETSGSVKIKFYQKPLPDFWIGLHSEYPALANCPVKTLVPFATTYLSRPSLAWKLNTGTDCVWIMILSSTPFSLTCGELFTIWWTNKVLYVRWLSRAI